MKPDHIDEQLSLFHRRLNDIEDEIAIFTKDTKDRLDTMASATDYMFHKMSQIDFTL